MANPPVFVAKLTAIAPFPVPLPIVFPVMVPMFTLPAEDQIPEKFPFVVDALELVFVEILVIVFPWILLATVVPAVSCIPTNRFVNVVFVIVHGVPAANGALPPIKLLLTIKLFPDALLLIRIPVYWFDTVVVLGDVW